MLPICMKQMKLSYLHVNNRLEVYEIIREQEAITFFFIDFEKF